MLGKLFLLAAALPFGFASPLEVPQHDEHLHLSSRDVLDLNGPIGDILTLNVPGSKPPSTFSLFANAQIRPATAQNKTINVKGGKWLGLNSYLGIPFAEPPTGENRFKAPKPKVYTGDVSGLLFAKSCLQPQLPLDGLLGQSEDCLYLNILTPDGTAGTNANLPVMVWLFGGAFDGGSGTTYAVPFLPSRAIKNGKPFILVTVNYRLGILGYGTGKQMAEAGTANLGLRDQKLALQWVQENIGAFGGDPHKVTLAGESAGSISTSLLMLDPNQKLFRAAIMQSGAPATLPMGRTETASQGSYDAVAQKVGCSGPNSFECIRKVDGRRLIKAAQRLTLVGTIAGDLLPFPFGPTIDGDLVPDSPYILIRDGKVSKIPYITGNNKDEATLFIPRNMGGLLFGTKLYDWMLKAYPGFIARSVYNKIVAVYPNIPSLGCPFDTGSRTFLLPAGFKQAAAIVTDATFHARRRWFLRKANQHGNTETWTYLFEAQTPILPDFLGVMHAVDVAFMFGVVQLLPIAGWGTDAVRLSENIQDYWVNFVYNMNPNGGGLPDWPKHSFPANKNCLRLISGGVGAMQDDFREDKIALFNQPEMASQIFARREEAAE